MLKTVNWIVLEMFGTDMQRVLQMISCKRTAEGDGCDPFDQRTPKGMLQTVSRCAVCT
jgi:hypothetical protein